MQEVSHPPGSLESPWDISPGSVMGQKEAKKMIGFGFAVFKNGRSRSRAQHDTRPCLTGGCMETPQC